MVQYAIAHCTSSNRKKHKEQYVCLFSVPSMPKPAVYKGKHHIYREKKSRIKKCQHEAWMLAINRGYEGNAPELLRKL